MRTNHLLIHTILATYFAVASPLLSHRSPIIGGSILAVGSIPFLVKIHLSTGGTCSGSLLSSTTVITARHCISSIENPNSIHVYAGEQIRKHPYYITPVENFFVHDSYTDVIILKLTEPIREHDKAIGYAKLASTKPSGSEPVEVAGWGSTRLEYKLLPVDPYVVPGSIAPDKEAKRVEDLLREYPKTNIWLCSPHRLIIKFPENRGSHQGDSGGPIVNSKKQLIGLTSHDFPDEELKGFRYTLDVSLDHLQDWISDVFNGKIKPYTKAAEYKKVSDLLCVYGDPSKSPRQDLKIWLGGSGVRGGCHVKA